MTTHELLKRGKRRIQRYGWQQGEYGNSRDGYCMLGAITYQKSCGVVDEAYGLFCQLIPGHNASAWNDAPGRTKADVLALYSKAIATTRPRKAKR